jgi:serine/threonine protein kinase
VQKFTVQLAKALEQLFKHNIVHRDLKLQNILITKKDFDCTLKLADFGMARDYEGEEDLFSTYVGSPIYMAPEI